MHVQQNHGGASQQQRQSNQGGRSSSNPYGSHQMPGAGTGSGTGRRSYTHSSHTAGGSGRGGKSSDYYNFLDSDNSENSDDDDHTTSSSGPAGRGSGGGGGGGGGVPASSGHYGMLGVSVTATEKEIKVAYRKLALQFHPDKNKDPGAEDKFKEIGTAYSVLSDKASRRQYDLTRPVSSRGYRK
jgi:hypothetical protein